MEQLEAVEAELKRSGLEERLPAGLVLSGGGALLPGLDVFTEKVCGLPTRIGYPMGVGGLQDTVNDPMYATAVGLLLWAAERTPIQREGVLAEGSIWETVRGWMRRFHK
jgi:cell division protein FtsA